MVQVSVSYRIFLIKVLLYGLADLILVHFLLQPYDIAPVRHYGADLLVPESKDILYDVLLHRKHFPFIRTFLDYRADFLFCHLRLLALQTQCL